MFQKINIQEELIKVRKRILTEDDLLKEFKTILTEVDSKREDILNTLNSQNDCNFNHFNIDKLDRFKIFHEQQIKTICANYRLRFLDSMYFTNDYPAEAISKIRELENIHKTKLFGFKIIAPLEAFKLKKADDPLLFAPLGNGYYYLIHKWGNDLHPLRKIKYWAFKNVENLLISLTFLSVFFTALTYPFFITKNANFGYLLMLFMFYFKGFVGMFFIIFGSSGKNFSEYSWQSQYDKIR